MDTFDLLFNAEEFRECSELMPIVWAIEGFKELAVDGTNLILKFETDAAQTEAYEKIRPLVDWIAPVTYYEKVDRGSEIETAPECAHSRVDAFLGRLREIYRHSRENACKRA